MHRATVLVAGFSILALFVVARPPPNADMSLAPWFQGLRQPGTGLSCCSIADCRPTDFRTNGNHYEAMVEGEWRVVPPHVILEQIENPEATPAALTLPVELVVRTSSGGAREVQ